MKIGLKKTPRDPRDYHYRKTFGDVGMLLPDEYFAARTKILSQKASMFCTAFATNVAAACEDGKDFSPEWFFAFEKVISGTPLTEGEDLRTPMKTSTKFGFLLKELALYSLENKDPNFLADYMNWPVTTRAAAEQFKKKGYFRVDGDFESVRQVLWQNKDFKRAIVTGVRWFNEWTMTQGGIVPTFYNSVGGDHCICIIGFTKKDGQDYIVVQDSDGENVGDHGLFYFNKTVFDREFNQPMYMLVDMDGQTQPQPIGNFISISLFKLMKLLCPGKTS